MAFSMRFADVYDFVNKQNSSAVKVKEVTAYVNAMHNGIGEVRYYPLELDEKVSFGHVVLDEDRTSAYEEPFIVHSVRFSGALNRCWRRLVCCKELMHAFDTLEERVNTRDKFLKLMTELETEPLSDDESRMFTSEKNAMWMAALVLCPERLRAELKPQYDDKTLDKAAIADRLKIPEQLVAGVMGAYYETALAKLTSL